MRYEDFASTWTAALRTSGLRVFGVGASEHLELHSLDRSYEISVEPAGGQDAEPFTVTAWRWSALHTARSTWREEEVLTELHGREQADGLETMRPRLRVDIVLKASLPWGEARPLPPRKIWARWVREVREGLDTLPEEASRSNEEGGLEVLAWRGQPELEVELTADGEPKYARLRIAALQILDLPRHFDAADQEDEGPEDVLEDLFARVRKALLTWTECLDLLPAK